MTDQHVYGMQPDVPLPDGWRPVGALAVLRCLDSAGQRRVLTVYAGDVMAWEAAGMLAVAAGDVHVHLRRAPHIVPDDGR